ncbi:site-specific integrase [Halomonas sp. ATCH28]|uniref:Site-specific integrase n=1 Tax=Halomonas gemina TaxID=2945105 RepID=A0ABT0T2W0_9GAMM|nr:site-specific integrase [Halomonas gemina]MCL7941265.1 site-specific integrase [Halomonas gemina]
MYLMRDRHNTWYLRIVLSDHIARRIGQREIRRSLGTKSKRLAWKKLPSLYAEAMKVIEGSGYPVETTVQETQGMLLSEAFDQYLVAFERTGVRPKSIQDKSVIFRLLLCVVGDKASEEFSLMDARMFKQVAQTLPPRVTNKLIDEGKSVEEIVKLGLPCVTVSTVNNWLRNLQSIFQWMKDEGYTQSNPFLEVTQIKEKVKASSHKDVFTKSESQSILEATRDFEGAFYWLPRLGMFTGARLGELCQLYKEDVYTHQEVPILHIRDTNEDQHLKSLSSERMVPVHSKIAGEFLRYVESLPDGSRVFPEFTYSKFNGYRGQYSKHFSYLLSKKLGIPKTFHCYRHTIANELKQQLVPENVIGALLGHTVGTLTNNRYGKDYQVSVLKNAIEAIKINED